jgi:Fe2+ transport system protein FeoA
VRSALLGDPLQIRILGYNISIRKAEAAGVEVELLAGEIA